MSIKKKNMNEMSSAAGSSSQGPAGSFFKERRKRRSKNVSAPFSPVEEKVVHDDFSTNQAYVLPPRKKIKKGKDVPKTKGKIAKLETKSERTLRESIRNLVHLSRIKYHEEQALREMQEQKLRKIIRYLINEGNEPSSTYSSTGETTGAAFIEKITVTLKQYASLVSTQAQREEFKKIYLTGIKNYLDALDEQYYILNPEERPGAAQQQAAPVAPSPAAPTQPAGQQSLQEAPAAPPPINAAKINPMSGIDNKNMVAQATAAAVQTVGAKNKTGHGAAEEALNRDLPQIDPLYNNLTFENFTVANADGSSRTTNDRKDFRVMLIGDQSSNNIGNIANEFIKIDIAKQTNDSPHKNDPSQTPALARKPAPDQAPAAPAATPAGPEALPPSETGAELGGAEEELPA